MRCLIACVWLVISVLGSLGVTVPLPRLGCFNAVLFAVRLNIPLTVSSSNLGGLYGIPAGISISQSQVIRPYVASRTPPLFALGISRSQGLYYNSRLPVIEPHVTWAGQRSAVEPPTALLRRFRDDLESLCHVLGAEDAC